MHSAQGFMLPDAVAVVLFFIVWAGHYYMINLSRYRVLTISYAMGAQRERWMQNMVHRGESPVDAILQNAQQQGVLFFASTTVLLIGGLAAALGSADRGVNVLKELPLSTTDTSLQWELKVLLLMFIFVFAFFKFAWSYRLYNYVLIMMGASPQHRPCLDHTVKPSTMANYANKLAKLHSLAARHFSTGLNAYFFALAACTWFLNAWVFMASTIWVALVLFRRAFKSDFLKIIKSTNTC
ncbi:MAG: DUF599 domain-containing protein [Granulosicoccus sp.]